MRDENEPTITENEFLAILRTIALLGKEGTVRSDPKTPHLSKKIEYLSLEMVAECLHQIANGDPEDREVAIEALHTEILTPLRDGAFTFSHAPMPRDIQDLLDIQDILDQDDSDEEDEDEDPGSVL